MKNNLIVGGFMLVLGLASVTTAAPPPAYTTRLDAARAAAKAGRHAEARTEYEAAIGVAPNETAAQLEYARTLEALGEHALAGRVFDKLLEAERSRTGKRQAEYLAGLARTERALGRADKARELYTASLALQEDPNVRVALGQLGGTPAAMGSDGQARPAGGIQHTAGVVDKAKLDLPREQAAELSGPHSTLDALCTAWASKGKLSGSLRCNPDSMDFLGRQTPLGNPIFEAMYFAPSREQGSPYFVALRLQSGWWGAPAKARYEGSSHDYSLQTITSLIREDPTGALVALRVRHRAWKPGGSPDAVDATVVDDLLVCGMGEREKPACLPERVLGAPNTHKVSLTEDGAVKSATTSGTEVFLPIFP